MKTIVVCVSVHYSNTKQIADPTLGKKRASSCCRVLQ